MELFKQRLKEILGGLLFSVIAILVILIPLGLANLIHKDGAAFLIIMAFAIFLSVHVIKFINWLFIEPFRKTR